MFLIKNFIINYKQYKQQPDKSQNKQAKKERNIR